MLDSDLAELYEVETGALNRATKRNEDRFPEDFRFRLTDDEYENLRCQIGISSGDLQKFSAGGRRYMPYVYTEQGVAMLSCILRSRVAVQASIGIMRAFVEMRHFIVSSAHMFEQIRDVERRQLEYQQKTDTRLGGMDERFERVFDYMETHETPSQKAFFEDQIYDTFELLISLVQKAKHQIVLADDYVDTGTLNILSKKKLSVAVTVWTHPKTSLTEGDVATFNTQYPTLVVKHTTPFHDRFLILDGVEGYLIEASLKDAGKKSFAITKLEDSSIVGSIVAALSE